MALENLKYMLSSAMAGKYAVGAFNILDYSSAKSVVKAAEEANSPVIIQTSAKTVSPIANRLSQIDLRFAICDLLFSCSAQNAKPSSI